MKINFAILIFSIISTFSFQAYAAENCPPPKGGQTAYTCEKILSSEIVGRAQDKIATAKYKVWLQDEGTSLCVDGRNSSGPTVEPGKGFAKGDSKYPQHTKTIPNFGSQELVVTSDSWKLIQKFDEIVVKNNPSLPRIVDAYIMDLKSSTLTVSQTTGAKSFATFKMECTPVK